MTSTIRRRTPDAGIVAAEAHARKPRAARGFGVLTAVEVEAAPGAKHDVEIQACRIHGVCVLGVARPESAFDPIALAYPIAGKVRGWPTRAVEAI